MKLCVCGCGKEVAYGRNFAEPGCVVRAMMKNPHLMDGLGGEAVFTQALAALDDEQFKQTAMSGLDDLLAALKDDPPEEE